VRETLRGREFVRERRGEGEKRRGREEENVRKGDGAIADTNTLKG